MNETVHVSRAIFLHLGIGDCHVRVPFGVVENLAVPVLLGASSIDQFVEDTFTAEQKIAPSFWTSSNRLVAKGGPQARI